jgi:hypothetical protein
LTDEQVAEIAQRGANGWLGLNAAGPAHDISIGRMSQGRAARMIQERSTQQARADIEALIKERSELRSAIKSALTECGWTAQAVERWLAQH